MRYWQRITNAARRPTTGPPIGDHLELGASRYLVQLGEHRTTREPLTSSRASTAVCASSASTATLGDHLKHGAGSCRTASDVPRPRGGHHRLGFLVREHRGAAPLGILVDQRSKVALVEHARMKTMAAAARTHQDTRVTRVENSARKIAKDRQ